MTSQPAIERMAKEIRLLKIYAAGSSLALVGLMIAGFAPAVRQARVIDAERINVRNADGRIALSIAGKGRLPGPMSEGREYPQQLSGGRIVNSGMIFFNERGDEVGGLTYHGDVTPDGYSSAGGITFDQFRQDQVVSLQYQDNGRSRQAGVTVWDRSTEITIDEILRLVDARLRAQGAARDSIERAIQQLGARGGSASRVFLGSQNRNATLVLRDTRGRPRLRLVVDSLDAARIEFVDSAGAVTRRFPE